MPLGEFQRAVVPLLVVGALVDSGPPLPPRRAAKVYGSVATIDRAASPDANVGPAGGTPAVTTDGPVAVGGGERPTRGSPAPRAAQLGSAGETSPHVALPLTPAAAQREREQVLHLAAQLGNVGHYGILGLQPGVTYMAVERAWKALRPRFDSRRTA